MKTISVESESKYIGLNTANGYTVWEFRAKPPYPKSKVDLPSMAVSVLRIEDKNKKIDFQGDDLGFAVRYEPMGCTAGSVKSYNKHINHIVNTSFVFCVEYSCPFKLIIESYEGLDLSGLTATFFRVKK